MHDALSSSCAFLARSPGYLQQLRGGLGFMGWEWRVFLSGEVVWSLSAMRSLSIEIGLVLDQVVVEVVGTGLPSGQM